MSTFDYASKATKAAELILKFGATTEVIDSNRTILSTGTAVRGELTKDNVPGTLTENVDAVFFLEPSFTNVVKRNFIQSQGDIYKIVAVEPVQPAETLLLYKVFVGS